MPDGDPFDRDLSVLFPRGKVAQGWGKDAMDAAGAPRYLRNGHVYAIERNVRDGILCRYQTSLRPQV